MEYPRLKIWGKWLLVYHRKISYDSNCKTRLSFCLLRQWEKLQLLFTMNTQKKNIACKHDYIIVLICASDAFYFSMMVFWLQDMYLNNHSCSTRRLPRIIFYQRIQAIYVPVGQFDQPCCWLAIVYLGCADTPHIHTWDDAVFISCW